MRICLTKFPMLLIAASLMFAFSCSSKKTSYGVLLSTQSLLKTSDGESIAIISKGSAVEFLNEFSSDSAMVKVKSQSIEGWINRASVYFNATPGVVIGATDIYSKQDSLSVFHSLADQTIVAVDTVSGKWMRVVFLEDNLQTGWAMSSNVSQDSTDISFVQQSEQLKQLSPREHTEKYAELLRKNSQSQFITMIKMNLTEAPDDALAKMNNLLNIVADKTAGQLFVETSNARWLLTVSGSEIVSQTDYSNEVNPRFGFFMKYVTQLPSFVKIGPRYEYAEAIDDGQSLKAYVLQRVDRSPENILALYNRFKGVAKIVLSRGDIETNDYYLNKLTDAYDFISRIPGYRESCAKISAAIAKRDASQKTFFAEVEQQREIYQPILDNELMQASNNQNEALWFHSFWVRRIAEGNDEVVYNIIKELTIVNRSLFAPLQHTMDDNNEDEGNESEPTYGEEQVLTCVFEDYGVGDCGHVIFSCGDFGDADTRNLDKAGKDLWNSLSVERSGEENVVNSQYVGKTFKTTMRWTTGPACNEGQGGNGRIQLVTKFELVK